jgi:hypothetical protein
MTSFAPHCGVRLRLKTLRAANPMPIRKLRTRLCSVLARELAAQQLEYSVTPVVCARYTPEQTYIDVVHCIDYLVNNID